MYATVPLLVFPHTHIMGFEYVFKYTTRSPNVLAIISRINLVGISVRLFRNCCCLTPNKQNFSPPFRKSIRENVICMHIFRHFSMDGNRTKGLEVLIVLFSRLPRFICIQLMEYGRKYSKFPHTHTLSHTDVT